MGIPVIVCTPNPNWKPGTQVADVLPAKGWATIIAAQARERIHTYRPGIDTLAMVGGPVSTSWTWDTKNDGVSFQRSARGGPRLRHHTVPVWRAHFQFRPPDTAKVHLTCPANTSATHRRNGAIYIYIYGGRMPRSCRSARGPNTPGAITSNSSRGDIDRLPGDDNPPDIILPPFARTGTCPRRRMKASTPDHPRNPRVPRARHADAAAPRLRRRRASASLVAPRRPKRHEWFIPRPSPRITELVRPDAWTYPPSTPWNRSCASSSPKAGTSAMGCLAWALGNTTGHVGVPTHDPSTIHSTRLQVKPTPTEDRVFAATRSCPGCATSPERAW